MTFPKATQCDMIAEFRGGSSTGQLLKVTGKILKTLGETTLCDGAGVVHAFDDVLCCWQRRGARVLAGGKEGDDVICADDILHLALWSALCGECQDLTIFSKTGRRGNTYQHLCGPDITRTISKDDVGNRSSLVCLDAAKFTAASAIIKGQQLIADNQRSSWHQHKSCHQHNF